jgi:hypothetical protein
LEVRQDSYQMTMAKNMASETISPAKQDTKLGASVILLTQEAAIRRTEVQS